MTATSDRNYMEAGPHVRRLVLTPLALLVGLAWLLPTLWLLAGSLRPSAEIFTTLDPVSWETFLPLRNFHPQNYANVFETQFGNALVNSLIVAIGGSLVGLVVASMAAFALAAMPVRGRRVLLSIIVISFMVPTESIAVPLANLFIDWSLDNSLHGIVLPSVADGLAVFLLYQFFLGIPAELGDAGRVDGASWWRIYWSIYLPLSVPALIGAGTIVFLFHWTAYLWPLLIAVEPDVVVGQVALAQLFGQFEVDFGMVFAAAVILGVIPGALLFFAQRHLISSVATIGLKE